LGRNGYQFLHTTGYPIPGYSTLNKKISNLQITFGLLNSLVEPLMAKIASMKNQHERDCIISVDEMQIKEGVCNIFSPTVLKLVTFNTVFGH
jgi:hypothetical protein